MRTDREALERSAKGAVSVSEETPCLVPPSPHLMLFVRGLTPDAALFRGGVERYSSSELALCSTEAFRLVCAMQSLFAAYWAETCNINGVADKVIFFLFFKGAPS